MDRSNRAKAIAGLRKAREKIEKGSSVVFFAEGTRSSSGKLLPFKSGGFLLALRTRTPIVPITIRGSGAILPKGDWRIREGDIEVIVNEPVLTDAFHRRDLSVLVNLVRQVMESSLKQRPISPVNETGGAEVVAASEVVLERGGSNGFA